MKQFGKKLRILVFFLDREYQKDLYNIANDQAEFILSVAVFSYPSNVFSVWIYLAAIVDSMNSYL